MSKRKDFKDLSPRSRAMIVAGATVQFGLLGYAWLDLRRRPADQVRGSKRAWKPALFVNFIGPLAYLFLGRRRSDG